MKNFKTVCTTLLVALLAVNISCAQWGSETVKGNGEVIEESRSLLGYSEISIAGNFEIILVEENSSKITITAESNLLKYITTESDNGKLNIEVVRKINLNPKEKITITIPYVELEEISMSGSGNLIGENKIKAKNFSIKKSGSGQMDLVLDVSRSLEISTSGSGNIQIEGNANSLEIKSSGSGKFEAKNLKVKDAEIKLSGSGEITVSCEDEIEAKISGSGKVYYYGDPSTIDTKVSGSGKIERL